MPIAQVGTGTGANGSYGTGFTLTAPGSLVASDVVLIVIATENATDPAFTATGFTELYQGSNSANQHANTTVLHGTGFTGSGGFAVTSPSLASGDWVSRVCTAWSGTDNAPVVGTAYAAGPGGSDWVIPSVTTTIDVSVVLACGSQSNINPPRTFTPVYTHEVHSNIVGIASRTFSSAGATGSATVTNAGFGSAVALLVALQELVAAAPPWLPWQRRHAPLVVR